MLLDTNKLNQAEEAHEDPGYTPSDFERAPEVYVFRMTWEGEDRGDLMNYADVLKFVMELDGDEATEEDARQWLDSGRTIRFGTDEEWYRVTPLEHPMKLNYFGELVPKEEPFYPEREERPNGSTGYGFPYTWKI